MLAAMSGGVLVVDDDPVFRGLVTRLLHASGLVVCGEAGSVETALAAAQALRPDAALVDVGHPDGSGIDLARALTALPWRPRVVLTSTDAEAALAAQVRESGAEAFIVKDELPGVGLARLLLR
jgi:DNA-binding NarL/FixJ family response regulator